MMVIPAGDPPLEQDGILRCEMSEKLREKVAMLSREQPAGMSFPAEVLLVSGIRQGKRDALGSGWPGIRKMASAAMWKSRDATSPSLNRIGIYENPIHRPPIPTADHSVTETRATSLLQSGPTFSAIVTLRRTVKVKTSASNRDVIFTQNAMW